MLTPDSVSPDLHLWPYEHLIEEKIFVNLVYTSVCCVVSHVRLFATLWTVAHQAFLSMEFSWQEYWSGLPFPPPGDLLDSGIEPTSPMSPALEADSLPLSHRESWMILPHVLTLTGSEWLQCCGPIQSCPEEHGERKSFWVQTFKQDTEFSTFFWTDGKPELWT